MQETDKMSFVPCSTFCVNVHCTHSYSMAIRGDLLLILEQDMRTQRGSRGMKESKNIYLLYYDDMFRSTDHLRAVYAKLRTRCIAVKIIWDPIKLTKFV